jgi:hypothetical protein
MYLAWLDFTCDELFSVLFHRRFADPQRCYSETTAFPADRLSAANMAAKLVISTLADVRHTMFMSGLTPFPPGALGCARAGDASSGGPARTIGRSPATRSVQTLLG